MVRERADVRLGYGQAHMGPALLHALERYQIVPIDLPSLLGIADAKVHLLHYLPLF
jgi:hypothetical protein